MMNTTQVLNQLYFKKRQKAIARYDQQAERIQRHVLKRLLRKATKTQWGVAHGYASIDSYEQFTTHVSVNTYEELKGYIQQMREGEKDVLWPGMVRWYAKSSGISRSSYPSAWTG